MRDFNDKDRKKKSSRIQLGENPANLPPETLTRLEAKVTGALKEHCLPRPAGRKIADDMAVPRVAAGAIPDKPGIRVTNCQLGFFEVDKKPYQGAAPDAPSPEITAGLRELDAGQGLTCAAVFGLARRLKTAPKKVSEAANILKLKIRSCQLGCF